jgi:hypothetical protein
MHLFTRSSSKCISPNPKKVSLPEYNRHRMSQFHFHKIQIWWSGGGDSYNELIDTCVGRTLGAVYTCDFASESPYNSVYDFLPKGLSQLNFRSTLAEICTKTIVMGVWWRIGFLSGLHANCSWNGTGNRTRIHTRVDGPLFKWIFSQKVTKVT